MPRESFFLSRSKGLRKFYELEEIDLSDAPAKNTSYVA